MTGAMANSTPPPIRDERSIQTAFQRDSEDFTRAIATADDLGTMPADLVDRLAGNHPLRLQQYPLTCSAESSAATDCNPPDKATAEISSADYRYEQVVVLLADTLG
jgi:hypothetical protein